jgi:hypothetical protein
MDGYKRSHFGDEVVVDFLHTPDAHQKRAEDDIKKNNH